MRSRTTLLSTLVSIAALGGLAALSPTAAHAQFALNAGTANGILELAAYNTVAGGAGANFSAAGQLLQAGGGYQKLVNYNNLVVNTGLINLPATQVSGANGTFGGGTASLFAVSGASAGVFTNNFGFTDANGAGAGIASATTQYGQAAWTYGGPAGFFVGGAYLTMATTVDPLAIGSYTEAGVDALFKVNGAVVGQAFISFGFDGVNTGAGYAGGPLASFINADRSVVAVNGLGNGVVFSAASYVGIFLNPGDVVAIQGTLTAFGDPSSMTYQSDPTFDNGNDNSNLTAAPEPGSAALLLPAMVPVVGVVARRRRRALRSA